MAGQNAPRGVRFGVFELDARTGELRKSGTRLKLQDQPFQILRELVLAPGELVTREQLQQKLWPDDTFVDFEHSLNAAVKKLRDILGDSARSPRYIETLPKKGYRFIAPVELFADEPAAEPTRPRRSWLLAAGALALIAAVLAVIFLRPEEAPPPRSFREIRLTFDPGVERHPSLSPDGNWVAYEGGNDRYVTGGAVSGEANIYVRLAEPGAGPPIRVTNSPGLVDTQPAWSPDGKQLVFVRILESLRSTAGTAFKLMVAPPVEDASARELTSRTFVGRHWAVYPTWSPDGNFVAFSCRHEASANPSQICLYSLERDEAWPLSFPPSAPGDWAPVFSPDGRSIAYYGNHAGEPTRIYVQPVNEEMRPEGEPRPAGQSVLWDYGWSRDGRTLYMMGESGEDEGLWSFDLSTGDGPRLMRRAGGGELSLWEGPSGALRIAYDAPVWRSEIVLIDLHDPSPEGAKTLPFADAQDQSPQFSPDGSEIAFRSDRGGATDGIWLWNLDDQQPPRRLREVGGRFVGAPQPFWSPDGKEIIAGGDFGEYRYAIVEVATGRAGPRLGKTGENYYAWSGDGNSIYKVMTGPGEQTIWKLDLKTGENRKLFGGGRPRESADGRHLYYLRVTDLMRIALGGEGVTGTPERIAQEVEGYSVVPGAVYYRTRSLEVRRHSEETGESVRITTLPPNTRTRFGDLSVSPDERWLAYTRDVSSASDIWMLESVE